MFGKGICFTVSDITLTAENLKIKIKKPEDIREKAETSQKRKAGKTSRAGGNKDANV